MANLKEIQGFSIQNLTEDPSPYAQALADNPYGGTWASGSDLSTAREALAGAGTQTASIVAGGSTSPGSYSNAVEYYNGTSWSEQTEINEAREFVTGSGTQTAAIIFAGRDGPNTHPGNVESWDGSSWTETTEMGTARRGVNSSIAPYTAVLAFGGYVHPGYSLSVELWNGSTWSEQTEISEGHYAAGSGGTSTSAITAGGQDSGPSSANTEIWNGSSWSETADLNTGRVELGGTGPSNTALLVFGGNPGPGLYARTENFDGTSWTEVNDLSVARQNMSSHIGSTTVALATGGHDASDRTASTEEWGFTGLDPSSTPAVGYSDAIVGQVYYNSTTGQFKSITDGGAPIGAWSSAANINTARNHIGGIGTSNSPAVAFGGSVPPGSNLVESYDGTSWSEVNELNNGRTYPDGAGTATAGLAIGGGGGSTPTTAGYTESWDGTNWTEVADLTRGPSSGPQSTVYGMASGIQTSALYYGGDEGSSNTLAKTESWDGSSWTEVADLNQAKSYGAGIGTSNTSALAATGLDWAPGSSRNTPTNEEWNGSSWTELAETNTARGFLGCGNHGSVTSALIFGGRNQGPNAMIAATEFWNGTSWTEVSDLATARLNGLSGSGSGSNAMFAGGGTPSVSAAAEEFTSTEFQIKTLTTS